MRISEFITRAGRVVTGMPKKVKQGIKQVNKKNKSATAPASKQEIKSAIRPASTPDKLLTEETKYGTIYYIPKKGTPYGEAPWFLAKPDISKEKLDELSEDFDIVIDRKTKTNNIKTQKTQSIASFSLSPASSASSASSASASKLIDAETIELIVAKKTGSTSVDNHDDDDIRTVESDTSRLSDSSSSFEVIFYPPIDYNLLK